MIQFVNSPVLDLLCELEVCMYPHTLALLLLVPHAPAQETWLATLGLREGIQASGACFPEGASREQQCGCVLLCGLISAPLKQDTSLAHVVG